MLVHEGGRLLLPLGHRQVRTSPCVRKLAISAPFTAFSRSQSEKMIRGDLPPSSKVTGLIPLADISMILKNKDKHRQKLNAQRSAGEASQNWASGQPQLHGTTTLILPRTLSFICLEQSFPEY